MSPQPRSFSTSLNRHCQNAWVLVIVAAFLFCSTGATCIPRNHSGLSEFQPPILFETPPTIHQIADVVNRTDNIRQLQSPAVTIRVKGLPSLSANLDWRRDRDFRMQGSVSRLMGVAFDIGSNPEIFWMSTQERGTPTLYFARHNEFEAQLNRKILPVSPLWVMEALGIIHIDPDRVSRPPQIDADGSLRVDSIVPSAAGNYYRTLTVDGKLGIVKEVRLSDPTGRLLAQAHLTKHKYHSEIDGSLPLQSIIDFTPIASEPMSLTVEVGFYRINENASIEDSQFANPQTQGFQVLDLVRLNAGEDPVFAAPGYQVQQPPTAPQYRGVAYP